MLSPCCKALISLEYPSVPWYPLKPRTDCIDDDATWCSCVLNTEVGRASFIHYQYIQGYPPPLLYSIEQSDSDACNNPLLPRPIPGSRDSLRIAPCHYVPLYLVCGMCSRYTLSAIMSVGRILQLLAYQWNLYCIR